MKLNNVYKAEGCEMEVWVEYDLQTNIVTETLSVSITWCGETVDASAIMIKYFEPCLNRLIEETDWREQAYDEVINDVF